MGDQEATEREDDGRTCRMAELRLEKEFNAVLLSSLPGIFYLYDAEFRLRRWNENHVSLTGFSPEELSLKSADSWFYSEEGKQRVREVLGRTLKTGEPFTLQGTLRHKDGHQIPILFTSRRIDTAEGPMVMGVGIDISDRLKTEEEKERLEAELAQAHRLEAIGLLAGGVAHDFNNILQTILATTELALQDAPEGSELRELLTETRDAAQRSSDFTRQLLAFARRQAVNPRSLDLNAGIEESLPMLRRLLGEGMELEWAAGASPANVLIDPSQLNQLLLNLCINAKEAAKGRGKVSLMSGNARIGEGCGVSGMGTLPGDWVVLSVTDDGPGIDPAVLPHIFEPFYSTKGSGRNSGLGLATVYGIVRQNGGFITVSSAEGEGTAFRVHLPPHAAESEKKAELESGAFPAASAAGRTVLVVEDDAVINSLVCRMLKRMGYEAFGERTPSDALRLAESRAEGIDLLILDLLLPEMDGPELAERLKALLPGAKILYMTGNDSRRVASAQGKIKGAPVLMKPFTGKELGDSVAALFRRAKGK